MSESMDRDERRDSKISLEEPIVRSDTAGSGAITPMSLEEGRMNGVDVSRTSGPVSEASSPVRGREAD